MKKAATGVIRSKCSKKFLLIKRGEKARTYSGYWFFPGGMKEKGETPDKNVIREIYEEIGLKFKPEKIIHEFKNDEIEITRFIGTARGTIKIQEGECEGFGWFTIEEALKLPIAFEGIEHIKHLRDNGYF